MSDRLTYELTDEDIVGLFETLCDAADVHPMTAIFTAYDRMMGGTETDEDMPMWLTDAARTIFDIADKYKIEALAKRWEH